MIDLNKYNAPNNAPQTDCTISQAEIILSALQMVPALYGCRLIIPPADFPASIISDNAITPEQAIEAGADPDATPLWIHIETADKTRTFNVQTIIRAFEVQTPLAAFNLAVSECGILEPFLSGPGMEVPGIKDLIEREVGYWVRNLKGLYQPPAFDPFAQPAGLADASRMKQPQQD